MSGVEIAGTAAAVSLITSGVSVYEQIKTANAATALQNDNIRQQQVQLRLQENQASIERMKKLQQVLATEEVTLGTRNISGSSGTALAFTKNNMEEFFADENADKLNYSAKQLALSRQQELNYQQRRATVFNAVTGFVKEGANTVMSYYQLPGKSLIDASLNTANSVANIEGTKSYQSYTGEQRSEFDLNA